jgi:hypothetical protein
VHLKRRIVAMGVDDVTTYEFSMPVATVVVPVAIVVMLIAIVVMHVATNC